MRGSLTDALALVFVESSGSWMWAHPLASLRATADALIAGMWTEAFATWPTTPDDEALGIGIWQDSVPPQRDPNVMARTRTFARPVLGPDAMDMASMAGMEMLVFALRSTPTALMVGTGSRASTRAVAGVDADDEAVSAFKPRAVRATPPTVALDVVDIFGMVMDDHETPVIVVLTYSLSVRNWAEAVAPPRPDACTLGVDIPTVASPVDVAAEDDMTAGVLKSALAPEHAAAVTTGRFTLDELGLVNNPTAFALSDGTEKWA